MTSVEDPIRVVPTRFTCKQPWGDRVRIAGSFDPPVPTWTPIEMKKNTDGVYEVVLDLLPNKSYSYKFVINNNDWVCDPDVSTHPDESGNWNHVIAVEPLPPPPELKVDQVTSECKEHGEEKEQEEELAKELTVEENEQNAGEVKGSYLSDETSVLTTEHQEEKEETLETETTIVNTIVGQEEFIQKETSVIPDEPFFSVSDEILKEQHVANDEMYEDKPQTHDDSTILKNITEPTGMAIKPVEVGEEVDEIDLTDPDPFEKFTGTVDDLSFDLKVETGEKEKETIEGPIVDQDSTTTKGLVDEQITDENETNEETIVSSIIPKAEMGEQKADLDESSDPEKTPLSEIDYDDYDDVFKTDLESIDEKDDDSIEDRTISEITVVEPFDINEFNNITWVKDDDASDDNVPNEWLQPVQDTVKWPVNPDEFIYPSEEQTSVLQFDLEPDPSSDSLEKASSLQLEPPTDNVKPPSLHSDDLADSSEESEESEEPEEPEEPVSTGGATDYYEPPSVWPPSSDDIEKWAEDWPETAKVQEESTYIEEEQETSAWHLSKEAETINESEDLSEHMIEETPNIIKSREIPSVEETIIDQVNESLLNEIPSTTNIENSIEKTVEDIATQSIVNDYESYVGNETLEPEIVKETPVEEDTKPDHDIGKEKLVTKEDVISIKENEDLKIVEDSTIDHNPSFIATAPESSATATAADNTSLDTVKEQHDYLGEDIVMSKAIEDLRKYDCLQETQSKSTGVNKVPAGKISQRKITLISPNVSSPGESTRNADIYINNVATSRETSTIKSKPKKPIEISTSREILPRDAKAVSQQRIDNKNTINGNFIFLIGSVATTFALGMISMIYKIVFNRRVTNNRR